MRFWGVGNIENAKGWQMAVYSKNFSLDSVSFLSANSKFRI